MFLLLIFFMVSSTFREQFGIDVDLPQAETAEAGETPPREILVTREGEIFLGEQRVGLNELRNELRSFIEADAKASFVLRADEQADFGAVVRVIDITRSVGATRLNIPTRYTGTEPGG